MAAFRILAAFDGSASARAALATAVQFPWPEGATARGVVALGHSAPPLARNLLAAERKALQDQVEPARRRLAERWPDAEVVARKEAPAKAILAEARRSRADAIVLGWRGHGAFRRLLAGSVSREVVREAGIPVLVARSALRAVRCLVLGFDASPGARRALHFVSRLEASRLLVVLASVVEPITFVPPRGLPTSVRATLRTEIARVNRERTGIARHKATDAAGLLRRAGFRTRVDVRHAARLDGLLEAAREREGSVLVVGRGRLAESALDYARVPVLIV